LKTTLSLPAFVSEKNWRPSARARVRDIIRATFDKEVFQSWVKKLRESAEVRIEKPIEAVENIVGHLNLSEEQKQRLLMHFSEPTKYGLINAIANLAEELKDVEEQVKLEEFAGEMLEGE